MIVKFNKYERMAGLFMLVAILGTGVTALSVAIKQGWFESKTFLTTTFENADGIHQGTVVQMAGLRAGAVDKVELLGTKKVRVEFHILGKFHERIRQDSTVQLVRPFIIGERALDVSVGGENAVRIVDHQEIPSEETIDLMNAMGGKKLSATLQKFSSLFGNLEVLAEAFLDKKRTSAMIRAFDRIDPMLKNVDKMTIEMFYLGKQLNNNKDLQTILTNFAIATVEINKFLPDLNRQNPELAKDLSSMTQSMAQVARALGPALDQVGPELPQATRRALEALNETVVVLKAMQKSFLLRSNVKEVHEEEASLMPDSKRMPASAK